MRSGKIRLEMSFSEIDAGDRGKGHVNRLLRKALKNASRSKEATLSHISVLSRGEKKG